MTTVQRANFEDLQERYFQDSHARQAIEVLLAAINKKEYCFLDTLLRDYRKRAVNDPREIEMRAAVDALLIGYSVMEMAALSGFIPPPNGSEFWKESEKILNNTQMRHYYIDFCPIPLPQLLLLRLQGRHQETEVLSSTLTGSLLEFLDLDNRFMRDLNESILMRMLDSFWYGDIGFPDIVHLIGDREGFVRSILKPPEERELADEVLQQFSRFMEFCFELRLLLDQLKEHALLQSEIWHHYGYWFDIIGKEMKEQLGNALTQFLRWEATGLQEREVKEYVARANQVIETLVSERYRKPVDSLLAAYDTPRDGR